MGAALAAVPFQRWLRLPASHTGRDIDHARTPRVAYPRAPSRPGAWQVGGGGRRSAAARPGIPLPADDETI